MRNRVTAACIVGLATLTLASCVYVANLSPQAHFVALPASGTTPLLVTLDASASSDPDGSIASFLWSFGDGQTGSQSAFPFTHTFVVQSESRTFTIVLVVTDDGGATDTAVHDVTVSPAP